MIEKQATLPQNTSYDTRRIIHEHPLDRQHHAAGRGQGHQAEVDDLEQDDAKDGFDDARADDVRLGEADLFRPATDVKGIGEADQGVDDHQVDVGMRPRRKAPREQRQGENGDAVGRQRDGVVAEPATAVGDVTVRIVHFEAVDLPAEKDGEQQMRELVRELHQPPDIGPHARDQEQGEESDEPDQQIPVEHQSAVRNGLPFHSLDQDADGDDKQGRKDKAGEDVADDAERFPYASFGFHRASRMNPVLLLGADDLRHNRISTEIRAGPNPELHPGFVGLLDHLPVQNGCKFVSVQSDLPMLHLQSADFRAHQIRVQLLQKVRRVIRFRLRGIFPGRRGFPVVIHKGLQPGQNGLQGHQEG